MSHDETFASAARALLARPLLDRDDPAWPDVATRRSELTKFFDHNCGWELHVDNRAGVARLKKRTIPDPTRPLWRAGGKADGPMRAPGYAVLMLAAADLMTRPVTTIKDLAKNLGAASQADPTLPPFDPTNGRHTGLLVDTIQWFTATKVLRVTAGSLEQYADETGDAVLVADTGRLSQLLTSSRPPSKIDEDDDWVAALTDEPRYHAVVEGRADADVEARHARHLLLRGLLDDPAVIVADLDEHVVRYLTSSAGRRVLREATAQAGFSFEENADCLLAIDPTLDATDLTFGRTTEIVTQVAVAILDHLAPNREVATATQTSIEGFVGDLLNQDPGWATAYQKPAGAETLTVRALDTLVAFRLVTVEAGTGTVTTTPVAGRFVTTVTDRRGATPPPADAQEELL